MNIVDTKEIIVIDGVKYQLHKKKHGELIEGTALEFRKLLFVSRWLKIALQVNEAVYFYKPYSKTMKLSGKLVGVEGFHAAIWWQTPNIIKNMNAQSSELADFNQVKRTSKLYEFLNKSIKN